MRYLFMIFITASIAGATGCAGSISSRNFVLLRHPVTNKTVECPGETGISYGTAAEMKTCVDSYTKNGYEEIYSY